MAKIVMEEAPDILTFPKDTLLDVKIEEANVVRRGQPGNEYDKLELKLKVLDIVALGDGTQNKGPYMNWIGQYVYAGCSWKFTTHPENKLRRWTEAIFRQSALSEGFELDSDLFVGRRARCITDTYEKSTRDSAGRPYISHKVVDFLEYRGDSAPAQQQQAPQQTLAQQQFQQYGQPQGQPQQAPQQDPWAPPAQQQQTAAAPSQTPADPWGSWPSGDEPPF